MRSLSPKFINFMRRPTACHFQFTYEEVRDVSIFIKKKINCTPVIGLVCGSGLGNLADSVHNPQVLKYSEIPGFPLCTAKGHAGRFLFGTIRGKQVAVMQGRFHFYEGYSLQQIALPIRVMKLLGVKTLILSNAAGALNEKFQVGDLMIVKDHINFPGFVGRNSLVGENDQRFGPRWLRISYDKGLQDLAKDVSVELGMEDFVREGVYNFQTGPMFETPAEVRYLKLLGADAAGMSTVPEMITAVHCGINVFAFSLITNICISDYDVNEDCIVEEVFKTGQLRNNDITSFVSRFIERI